MIYFYLFDFELHFDFGTPDIDRVKSSFLGLSETKMVHFFADFSCYFLRFLDQS